jgi:hypothetical protein
LASLSAAWRRPFLDEGPGRSLVRPIAEHNEYDINPLIGYGCQIG